MKWNDFNIKPKTGRILLYEKNNGEIIDAYSYDGSIEIKGWPLEKNTYDYWMDYDEFLEETGMLTEKNTFYTLDDLSAKEGDIVVSDRSVIYLLRDGVPEEFNTALCASIFNDSDGNEDVNLCQLGFHWCGPLLLKFRKASEEEKKLFVDCCVDTLTTPIEKDDEYFFIRDIFGENEYSQILHSLIKYNLVDKSLNNRLKKIHKTDLLKLYKKKYGE